MEIKNFDKLKTASLGEISGVLEPYRAASRHLDLLSDIFLRHTSLKTDQKFFLIGDATGCEDADEFLNSEAALTQIIGHVPDRTARAVLRLLLTQPVGEGRLDICPHFRVGDLIGKVKDVPKRQFSYETSLIVSKSTDPAGELEVDFGNREIFYDIVRDIDKRFGSDEADSYVKSQAWAWNMMAGVLRSVDRLEQILTSQAASSSTSSSD